MHLLRVADLSARDVARVLDLSDAFKRHPPRSATLLHGAAVVLYFAKPSTRTRISFETAIHRLGGVPVTVGPNDLQIGRGETIEDTARVVSRMSRAFVARTFADDELARFARAASIPVVNALTDGHHPCQALADLMTVRERFGRTEGLTMAYVGAGNNVTHSLMEACALAGMHVRVGTPKEYLPDPAVVEAARVLASRHGVTLTLTDDPAAAVDGVDAIYTDTWLSMGDPPSEREERIARLSPFQVNGELFARAKPTAIFMHCLPAHRGEEVTDDVADSPRSVIFDQAENRLHTSLGILEMLVTHSFEGSASQTVPAAKVAAKDP
jgi:ornithine carbamoyltransferase